MSENIKESFEGVVEEFIAKYKELYWIPLLNYVSENKELLNTVTGFLIKPEKLVLYYGKTHLAIEYFGSERINSLNFAVDVPVKYYDLTESKENFLEEIIGFKFDSTHGRDFPMPQYSEDIFYPTDKGFDKLLELKWNFSAESAMLGFNLGKLQIQPDRLSRHINSMYFDADENGLKTRRIKWIDFIPLRYSNSKNSFDSIMMDLRYITPALIKADAQYIFPIPNKDDYIYSKLPQINRFIEIVGTKQSSETEITSFLTQSENKFIMSMAFVATAIHSQLICDWQSEVKDSIKPDFFILKADQYGHIVEFKLPHLKSNSVVGANNRETFSAEINSYISQTRVYSTYFDDPNNRKWFENKYGFKVFKPKRILVIGRRWDFSLDVWKEIISDYKDIEIMTYDDLVDGIVAQLYI